MSNHLAIPVKDLKESEEFYQKLGFKVFNSWEKDHQELKVLLLQDRDGYKIELIYYPTNKDLKFPEIIEVQHLGIEVKDLEEKIEELKKQGIEIIVPIIQLDLHI